jgi:hypothetical protein
MFSCPAQASPLNAYHRGANPHLILYSIVQYYTPPGAAFAVGASFLATAALAAAALVAAALAALAALSAPAAAAFALDTGAAAGGASGGPSLLPSPSLPAAEAAEASDLAALEESPAAGWIGASLSARSPSLSPSSLLAATAAAAAAAAAHY